MAGSGVRPVLVTYNVVLHVYSQDVCPVEGGAGARRFHEAGRRNAGQVYVQHAH
jgi:hypothetical protein